MSHLPKHGLCVLYTENVKAEISHLLGTHGIEDACSTSGSLDQMAFLYLTLKEFSWLLKSALFLDSLETISLFYTCLHLPIF